MSKLLNGRYEQEKIIGRGTQGCVILVSDRKEANKKKAIKQVFIQDADPELIPKTMSHDNIVKYFDHFHDDQFLYIVFEHCESGDLEKFMNEKELDEAKFIDWFKQLVIGLKYLHSNKCIHRDMKLKNILIKNDNVLKIADFGISKILKKDFTVTKVGSPAYWSPEIHKGGEYSYNSDVWALGVIFYEMCMRSLPFDGFNQNELKENILNKTTPKLNKRYECFDYLLSRMLEKNKEKRANIDEIYSITEKIYWDEINKSFCYHLCKDLKVRSNYCQVLMNCIVANKLMIEEDPLKKINTVKEKNTIKRLIKSKQDVNYMICDCSDDRSKTLLLSFGLTKSMEDFLLSYQFCDSGIKGVQGSFHTGLYQRAQNIPIHDLINLIINDDYEIIFTGYSLGACIAALVAIRIITHEKIFKDELKRNKVLFFGFGAPAFCNNQFKQFIEKECKNNFHFHIHNRDHTIKIMDYLVDYCLSKKDIMSDNLEFKLGLQLIESVTSFSKEILTFQLLSALNFDLPNSKEYQYFGNIQIFPNINEFNLEKIIIDLKTLLQRKSNDALLKKFVTQWFSSPYDLFFKYYFGTLTEIIAKTVYSNQNSREIVQPLKLFDSFQNFKQMNEEDDLENNSYCIEIVKNVYDFDIYLRLCCKNAEMINDGCMHITTTDYESETIQKNSIRYIVEENQIIIRFTMRNTIEGKKAKFELISNFETLISQEIVLKLEEAKEGYNQKQKNIEGMPLEELYLYAVFYVNTFQNIEDEAFKLKCEVMEKILEDIDNIWNLKGQNHEFNKAENINQLKMFMVSFFGNGDNDIFKSIVDKMKNVLQKDTIKFNDKFVSLKDCAKQKKPNEMLYYIIPTCYEIMKRQLGNIFSIKDMVMRLNNTTKVNTYDKDHGRKGIYYFKNIAMGILASPILVASTPYFLYRYYKTNDNYMDSLFSIAQTADFRILNFPEVGFAMKYIEFFKKFELSGINPFNILVSTLRGDSKFSNMNLTIMKKVKMLRYTLNYPGSYEKILFDWLVENVEKTNDELHKMVICNRKLRDILLEDWLIGVVGEKSCGKSTFIEKMIGISANASAYKETSIMKPYKISDSIILIDYPHFDSNDIDYKFQFFFTQKLLDHTFMLCEAKKNMNNEGTKKLFTLIKSHNENFTIFLNSADLVWEDENTLEENKENSLDEVIKNVLNSNLKELIDKEDDFKKKLHLTCLTNKMEGIAQHKILHGIELKKKVYNIILETIEQTKASEEIRNKLIEKMNTFKDFKYKKIEIFLGFFKVDLVVTNNKKMCKAKQGIKIYDDFEQLVVEFKASVQNPQFKIKKNQKSIESIDDFLTSDEYAFEVSSK